MFPLVFFNIMVHLVVHLPYEIKVTSPISYNWMYPTERSLRTLKQFVWNKVCPDGSIAKAYLMNELGTFCSCYLNGIKTRFTRDERNDDSIPNDEVIGEFETFKQKVQSLGASSL